MLEGGGDDIFKSANRGLSPIFFQGICMTIGITDLWNKTEITQ